MLIAAITADGEDPSDAAKRELLEETVAMVMDGRINANSTAHIVLKVERMMNQNEM